MSVPKLVLDPQNEEELLKQYYQRVINASGGVLSTPESDPMLSAFAEGVVFAQAELLYYLNLLPEALALEVFRLAGVERIPGTYAKGELTFLLSSQLPSQFFLSAGTVISVSNTLSYTLDSPLVIAAGQSQGTVAVTCTKLGLTGNLPAYGINIRNSGLNYVAAIFNAKAITGGSDIESLPAYINRVQRALRTRDTVISLSDYENKAAELLGDLSIAKAIPLLKANKLDYELGHVHVFCLDSALEQPSIETCNAVKANMIPLICAGTELWVSPMALEPVEIEVVIDVEQISQELADDIYQVVSDYLHPSNDHMGNTLLFSEIAYRVRSVDGVSRVISTLINGDAINYPMPLPYATPKLEILAITMTDPDNNSQTYLKGTGIGDPD